MKKSKSRAAAKRKSAPKKRKTVPMKQKSVSNRGNTTKSNNNSQQIKRNSNLSKSKSAKTSLGCSKGNNYRDSLSLPTSNRSSIGRNSQSANITSKSASGNGNTSRIGSKSTSSQLKK